ncbi:MAG: Crp/Fnr family transcriptional regulator [Prevotella sp.]|nr:Crp/Fnr family transcriptional regulator [Prevotella sp.]
MSGLEMTMLRVAQSMAELWVSLTDEQRQLLVDGISVCRFQRHDIIYHEKDKPAYLYCLLKGKVKIYKEGVGGRKQIVRMVRPHEFFGYRAGFVDGIYITEASAFEDTTLCRIPLPVIKQIIRSNHLVAIYFIKQLARLLGKADEQTVSLTQKHIRGRLAEALLRLRDSYGFEDDERTLAIKVSREDLASLSNMTTSNAIRTLSGFAGEGLVAIDGRRITLLDEPQLAHISQNG